MTRPQPSPSAPTGPDRHPAAAPRATRRRGRRVRPGLALATALPLALAGCGAGDAARTAATDAASSASASARQAATDKVLDQVCQATTGSGPLADVRLSDAERHAVGTLAALADAAGVPEQYVNPLRRVADSKDGQDVTDAITSLRTACENRSGGSAG